MRGGVRPPCCVGLIAFGAHPHIDRIDTAAGGPIVVSCRCRAALPPQPYYFKPRAMIAVAASPGPTPLFFLPWIASDVRQTPIERINPWRPICFGSMSGHRSAGGTAFRSMERVESRHSRAFGPLGLGWAVRGWMGHNPTNRWASSVARLSSSLCPDRASINEERARPRRPGVNSIEGHHRRGRRPTRTIDSEAQSIDPLIATPSHRIRTHRRGDRAAGGQQPPEAEATTRRQSGSGGMCVGAGARQ